MRGLMQDEPLVLARLLERAVPLHPRTEIVTRTGPADGEHRQTYEAFGERVARLASALRGLGVRSGDRVATFAWNGWRHLELYFAIPCMGAVLHPLNIRLHPDELAWVSQHAEDRVLFVDAALLDRFAPSASGLRTVEQTIVMGEPAGEPPVGWLDYETLIDANHPLDRWPDLGETDACMLTYTSGTTGRPKGVVYSHRSVVLHATMTNLAETIGLTAHDVVLPVVPMFHAGAWGFPHAATMAGTKQVFTGPLSADPATLAELIARERVTVAAGIPTVWVSFLHHVREHGGDVSSLRLVKTGGAPLAPSLIEAYERELGVEILQGWGMTETGTLAALGKLSPEQERLPAPERHRVRARAGRAVPGIRLRIVDPATGEELPWDGKSAGEVLVRGPWVAAGYYRDEDRSREAFVDGWLRTGDVGTIDEHGSLQLVDRAKDLVKSGGEWISSLELENALAAHPAVSEACVVGMPDERWGERPLAYVVPRTKAAVTPEELRDFLAPAFPKWWLPDRIELVEAIPKTSIGKFDKKLLRARQRPTA